MGKRQGAKEGCSVKINVGVETVGSEGGEVAEKCAREGGRGKKKGGWVKRERGGRVVRSVL